MALWLVPVCLFALLGAMFLGGTPIEPQGGSPLRQVLGLFASAAVYVVLWNVLRLGFQQIVPAGPGMGLASVVSVPLIWVASWIGFLVFGVKLGRAAPAH